MFPAQVLPLYRVWRQAMEVGNIGVRVARGRRALGGGAENFGFGASRGGNSPMAQHTGAADAVLVLVGV